VKAVGVTSCPWCGAEFTATDSSCPRCGASTDVRATTDADGWVELPGVKDLTTIQFGQSRAQIEGTQVPVVDVSLADGEGVYCTHDKLLWLEPGIHLGNKPSGSWSNRARAGMPPTLLEATGPGRIAFSDNHPGELVVVPIEAGGSVVAREHHMLVASTTVGFQGSATSTEYETGTGDDREYHYPLGYFVDQFYAYNDVPGLLILHALGNVFTRRLRRGEVIDVAPHAFLAARDVNLQLLIERQSWTHYLSLQLIGPGTVWIQSGSHGRTEVYQPITGGQNVVTRQF
jgi:uncharacterized protein (AIM24 family)